MDGWPRATWLLAISCLALVFPERGPRLSLMDASTQVPPERVDRRPFLRNGTASVRFEANEGQTGCFTHDGPPGALLVEANIANFSLDPAYVQPIKFVTVRDRR
jgi:hypothetical protein